MIRVCLAALIAFFALAGPAQAQEREMDTFRQLDLLMKIFETVRGQYVEETDDGKLIEGAIRGMLIELDPHSGYIGPDDFREMQIQTRGEYGGVGLEVIMDDGALLIISPMDDTPGSRAGLLSGDYITHVDGEQIFGMDQNTAVNHLRGPVDTDVVLTVVRKDVDAPFDVTLTREIITLSAVSHRIERDSIGYIRLTTFNNERLSRDLRGAIRDVREELGDNLRGLVLDLRNNPGGLLNQAIEVSDMFLDKGEIVSTRGRREVDNARWNATRGDIVEGLPIVVLANAGSASASEIVIGALQDHRRATVIGDKSFGKGVVQSVIPLGPERALRLTTARYYTPAGRAIQARGIEPDIEVLQVAANGESAGNPRRESDLRNHIAAEDDEDEAAESVDEEETLSRPAPTVAGDSERTDYQLQYALDLLEGVVRIAANQAPAP